MVHRWLSWLRARLTFLEYVSIHIIAGFLISLACLWVFGELADEILEDESLVHLDHLVAQEFHAAATPIATQFFLIVTTFGQEILWVIAGGIAIFLLTRRLYFRLAMLVVALIGGQLLNSAIKLWFARPRPTFENPITTALYYSFPSGHAMMSLIMYGLLAYFLVMLTPYRSRRLLIITTAALIILLVGLSRLYLGVHYVTDVLAGFAAGGLWLSTCITALNFLRDRSLYFRQRTQLENQNPDNANS